MTAAPPVRSAPRRRPSRLPALLGWCLLGAWLCLLSGYLVLRHQVWPGLDAWREPIAQRLSSALGQPVRIARLDPGFEGLLPRLTVEGLVLGDPLRPDLSLSRLTLVLSPRSLWALAPRFSLIELQSPELRVAPLGGARWRIAGAEIDLSASGDPALPELLSQQRRVLVRDARIVWADAQGRDQGALGGIDAQLGSVGRRHRVSLAVPGLPGWWEGWQLAGEIFRAPRSAVTDWRGWTGELYAAGDAIELAAIARLPAALLPAADRLAPLREGRADLRAWLRFQAGGQRELALKLQLAQPVWQAAAPGAAPLRLAALGLEGQAVLAADRTRIVLDAWQLRDAAGLSLSADGPLRLELDANHRPVRLQAAMQAFEAGPALALLRRAPWPSAWTARLATLRLDGRATALALRWQRPSEEAGPEGGLEAIAGFERLSGRVSEGGPWAENLAGEGRFTRAGLELRLDARGAVLGLPGVFAEPAIGFDELQARLRVTAVGEGAARGVELTLSEARFANADAAGSLAGRYRSGGRGLGLVDFTGQVDRADAQRVWRYLPLGIAEPVRDWVRRAVLAGRLDDARFRVRGDLADFPFAQPGQGEFLVDARLNEGALRYAQGWPRIDAVQGRLRFERNAFQVSARSGRVLDLPIGPSQAGVRDFDEGVLRVEGGGEGEAQQMIRFLNETPLATRLEDFTRDTRLEGDARLQLRLEVPLHDPEASRVAGTLQLRGNRVQLDDTLPPFEAVTGVLDFTERSLALRDITARFLGGPLRVSGETPEPGRLRLRAQGRVGAEAMRAVVDNPLTRRLAGEADFTGELDIARRAVSMQLSSDLVGLGLAMPAPFNKPSGAAWPLRVSVTARPGADAQARSPGDAIRVELGDAMRLVLERERDPASGRLRILRGGFATIGEPDLPDSGLALRVEADRVDLDAWMPLLTGAELRDADRRADDGFAPGFSLLPSAIAAITGELQVGGKHFHQVVIGATREAGFWQANVVSREVDGHFSWRDALPGQRVGALTARFNRLEIPKSRAGEFEALLDSPPEALPALDVAATEFILGERRLGQLTLKATNTAAAGAPVWRLDELRVIHPAARLLATGRWAPARAGNGRATDLDFQLDVLDAGELLAVYGIPDSVRGGSGRLSGRLAWQGSPLAIHYPSLDGAMRLQIGKGQFLKTEPGLAKLIGVLNLQSLPRRLSLDFRDVFSEGFGFDAIEGDVDIRAGIARSTGLQMRGLQAQVDIRGEADLELETQSLLATIRPELNVGLASLAYGAMANPAIGLGSFIFQFALRRPLQEIFTYQTRITGSWADPQVTEVPRQPGAPTGRP
ncbi:MAG: TIGR02099 family protein [Betaproteobacteria bacterium]|nr:TIGR02099 family protein [Betaproteobacteria bacterium]